jgi:hypothetical protein
MPRIEPLQRLLRREEFEHDTSRAKPLLQLGRERPLALLVAVVLDQAGAVLAVELAFPIDARVILGPIDIRRGRPVPRDPEVLDVEIPVGQTEIGPVLAMFRVGRRMLLIRLVAIRHAL